MLVVLLRMIVLCCSFTPLMLFTHNCSWFFSLVFMLNAFTTHTARLVLLDVNVARALAVASLTHIVLDVLLVIHAWAVHSHHCCSLNSYSLASLSYSLTLYVTRLRTLATRTLLVRYEWCRSSCSCFFTLAAHACRHLVSCCGLTRLLVLFTQLMLHLMLTLGSASASLSWSLVSSLV